MEWLPLGNTAQFVFSASWKICALISSLFLEIHKVFLQKSAFTRPCAQIFSGFALAELCGIALHHNHIIGKLSESVRIRSLSNQYKPFRPFLQEKQAERYRFT